MHEHLRIAHRQCGSTTIQCGEDLEFYFEIGAAFDAIYLEAEKTLVLTKYEGGSIHCTAPNSYQNKDATRSVCFPRVLPSWMPAFRVAEAEFEVDDELLIWRRPPLWALAWTTVPLTSSAERNRQAAIDGLKTRLQSAKRNLIDPKKVTTAVPSWAKSAMLAGDWMRVVRDVFPDYSV